MPEKIPVVKADTSTRFTHYRSTDIAVFPCPLRMTDRAIDPAHPGGSAEIFSKSGDVFFGTVGGTVQVTGHGAIYGATVAKVYNFSVSWGTSIVITTGSNFSPVSVIAYHASLLGGVNGFGWGTAAGIGPTEGGTFYVPGFTAGTINRVLPWTGSYYYTITNWGTVDVTFAASGSLTGTFAGTILLMGKNV